MNAATTTVMAPDSTTGRSTAVIAGMNPNVTYDITFYVIDANTGLLFDSDPTRVLVGN